jgi:hypothetical protein
MKGIELTKTGPEGRMVWIPLTSIALVHPYVGPDGKHEGTELVLNINGSADFRVQVKETYVTVIEGLQKL